MKKIEQMSIEEICNRFSSTLLEIYETFEFCKVPKEKYNKIVYQEILKSLKDCLNFKDYESCIKNKIINRMEKIVKNKLICFDVALKIASNYINQYLVNPKTPEDALKNFDVLQLFFEKYSYTVNSSFLFQLTFRNVIYDNMLNLVLEEYKDIIDSRDYKNLFVNPLIILTIDAYLTQKQKDKTNEPIFDDFDEKEFPDSVKLYLKEISKYPILSAKQERDYLIKIAKNDQVARQEFINSNLRLVVTIVKKYMDCGLPLLDLIQEGNIALIKAVDKFEISKNFRFSTYGIPCIESYIIRLIENTKQSVRIPIYLHKKINSYKKIFLKLCNTLGRVPTKEELAKEMNVSVLEIERYELLQNDVVSLNTIVDEDKATELQDFLFDKKHLGAEEIIVRNFLSIYMEEIFELSKLTKKEIEVVKFRYGFYGDLPLTLEEIGKMYGTTRQNIYKIHLKAIRKMRKLEKINDLAVYLANPDRALERIKELKK